MNHNIAKKYGLVIKPSTNVKKNIDVFRNDIKIAQVGSEEQRGMPNSRLKSPVKKIFYVKSF